MSRIKRALISVYDKRGIIDFAKELKLMNIEILSTGGTAKTLREAGIPVKDVSEYTGFPEMLDGRVKNTPSKGSWWVTFEKRQSKRHGRDKKNMASKQ